MPAPAHHLSILAALAVVGPCAAQQFTFAPPVNRACTPGHTPTRVVHTDVDQDGALDLLLPGRDTNKLINWVSLAPDGVPGIMQEFASPGQTDAAVAGDFNGDGLPDLAFAVRAYSGKLAVYFRTAQGLAAEPVLTQLDREPRSLVAGDWDGDGFTDLASAQFGNQAVLILRNDGTGQFEITHRIPIEAWSGPIAGVQELLVGDLNGDGRDDLVVTALGTYRVDVLLSAGDGSFAHPVAWMVPDLANGTRPGVTTAALGDLDGDGDLDLAVTLLGIAGPQPLLVMRNDGTGQFAEQVMFDGAEFGLGWGTALGDLDGDGDLDAVTGTVAPGMLIVWENRTIPGGPILFEPVGELNPVGFPRDIYIGHLDQDCDADIAVADISSDVVRVFRQLRDCPAQMAMLHAPPSASRGREETPPSVMEKVQAAQDVKLSTAGRTAAELALALAGWGAPVPVSGVVPLNQEGGVAGEPPAVCGPGGPGGRCDEPHPTPGCFTTPCCAEVCAVDPYCCESAWDAHCVDLRGLLCMGMICPQYGACDEVHNDPGCEDPECCTRILRLDPYCGELWDHICVERAVQLCGLPPCTIDIPANAVPEGELCYESLNDGVAYGTNDVTLLAAGLTVAGECDTTGPRDTDWYVLALPAGTHRVRVTVNAEFPCELHLVRGVFTGPLSAPHTTYGGFCTPAVLETCLDAETPWYAVVSLGMPAGAIRRGQPCLVENPEHPWNTTNNPPPVPGYDGYRYTLAYEVLSCTHGADLNGDGVVNGADLGLLLSSWGACVGCPADLNGDGVVNGADLGLLLAAWGVQP